MEKWIWFDMDGTIADFYNVPDWLENIRAFNPRPYAVARPMYHMGTLNAILERLRERGYHIGVISWLAREPNTDFDLATIRAKNEWLEAYGMAKLCDEIIVCSHGLRKADMCKNFSPCGILVDDEPQNRTDWNLGDTINAQENILIPLLELLNKKVK